MTHRSCSRRREAVDFPRLAFLALLWLTLAVTNTPARGEIIFEGNLDSQVLTSPRRIHIYLPPTYKTDPTNRYPVLYVHDGQNAFTTAGTGAAFGWGPWNLDTTADRLIAENKIQPLVIVAIDCSRERYQEYRGPKPWLKTNADDTAYQRYAKFLTTELKPKIDREYRTKPGPADTALLGSSMGGVASLALAWEYPETFGKLASLSGAFQVEDRAALKKVFTPYTGPKKKLRIYLDSGSTDYTGGDDGLKDTQAVANELKRIGYSSDELLHFIDPILTEDQLRPLNLSESKFKEARTQHNELYWRLRAHRPLEFLFPPK